MKNLENWSHSLPLLLKSGRCSHFVPSDLDDEVREEFEKAQQAIAANPNAPSTPQQPAAQSRINNLASSLKTAAGVWSCSACLSQNKAESTSCAACQTARFEDKSDG